MMDTSEMEDIFEIIKNEYDENDDEFLEDSLDLDGSSDLKNDFGLSSPYSSTNSSSLSQSDSDEMNDYLEGAWKQMEMEVEAELIRKKMKSEETDEMYSHVVADSDTKTPATIEGGQYGSDSSVNFTSNDSNEDNTEESKDFKNKWISDALLPLGSGFMVKSSSYRNAKTFIKTPDGHVFDSRRKLLQEMMTNGIYPQYYGHMYQGLLQDGWTINDSLPEGWLYKYNKSGSDNFLDQSFNLFKTRRKAREKILETHGNFSAVLKRFDDQTVKREQSAANTLSLNYSQQQHVDNNEAATLPKGFRFDNSTQMIICPGGNHYNSRVDAFQQMCSQQSSEEIKTDMFDKLIFEGFQAHELLALGWIYKQDDDYQVSFLDYNGTFLNSLSEAQQYFQEIFSIEEYQSFETFLSTFSGVEEIKTEEDSAVDLGQTVPEGWRVSEAGLTGPEGEQFSSRLEALVTILENEEREEEAGVMRHCLYYEGWCDDQYLPYMWKYKLDLETGSPMIFLTRECQVLRSQEEALAFVRVHSPPFTEEDVQRIEYVSGQHHPGKEEVAENKQSASSSQQAYYCEDKRYCQDLSQNP